MTCRNYIPGPNGDDVRALLEELDRLPVDVRVYDGYRTVEVPSSLFDKAVEALRAALNGDCQRCGEMRAGHAGAEQCCSGESYCGDQNCPAKPRAGHAGPGVVEIEQMMSGAGHAGGAMHDRAMSLPTLEDLRSVVSLPQDNDTHISNLEKMYTEAREIIIGLL